MSTLVSEVREAMQKQELQAFYQPQYDSITNRVTSAEALVRWIKPDGKIVPPYFFIPEAEETGFVIEIDWYMTRQVCRMLAEQIRHHERVFPVAVNFSRYHIREKNFTEKLVAIAGEFSISHSLLEVEITESAMVSEGEDILTWLTNIREAGFTVAIDDFGSGLSSLQFVKDMPADVLKIDKSLLSHNCEMEKERIVLESVLYFAHRLHMTTIAEGVETKEQLAFLRTCDCRKIQGYVFAKPMPESDYLKLCQKHKKAKPTEDILKFQTSAGAANLLMDVIFRKYPLVIFSNLSRNSYYMMAYENFTRTSCASAGVFDELIISGAASMYPDDREIFAQTFNRENLLSRYEKGETEVRLVTRQMGNDGIYRKVETTDYFVKTEHSDDVIGITLCSNLPEED